MTMNKIGRTFGIDKIDEERRNAKKHVYDAHRKWTE